MTLDTTHPPCSSVPGLDPQAIEAYLHQHPEFLAERADIMAAALRAVSLGDNVVDFQAHALRDARRVTCELRLQAQELIENAQANMNAQLRAHRAVLALLAAATLSDGLKVLTDDLPALLHIDCALLYVEPEPPAPLKEHNIPTIKAGLIRTLLGQAPARLRRDLSTLAAEERDFYGNRTNLVHSDALVRLDVKLHAPPMLLALADYKAGTFSPEQGTELMLFLAQAISARLTHWLAMAHDRRS